VTFALRSSRHHLMVPRRPRRPMSIRIVGVHHDTRNSWLASGAVMNPNFPRLEVVGMPFILNVLERVFCCGPSPPSTVIARPVRRATRRWAVFGLFWILLSHAQQRGPVWCSTWLSGKL